MLLKLTVAGEVIEATPNHAFYIHEKGWIEAGDIEVGDYVTLQNDEVAAVEKVAYTVLETPVKVYNFTVEGLHNYYVGELEIMVHNTCPGNSGDVGNTSKYIPKTGKWEATGVTKNEWLKKNNSKEQWGADRVSQQNNRRVGKPYSMDIVDANGNIIGRVDKNYRVDGKVVPEHVHLNSDVGNVHHWFNN